MFLIHQWSRRAPEEASLLKQLWRSIWALDAHLWWITPQSTAVASAVSHRHLHLFLRLQFAYQGCNLRHLAICLMLDLSFGWEKARETVRNQHPSSSWDMFVKKLLCIPSLDQVCMVEEQGLEVKCFQMNGYKILWHKRGLGGFYYFCCYFVMFPFK